MSTNLTEAFYNFKDSQSLIDLIKNSKLNDSDQKCGRKSAVITDHQQCFVSTQVDDKQLMVTDCPKALLSLIIDCIVVKPDLLNDEVRRQLSDQFKCHKLKAEGLIDEEILKLLLASPCSQTTVWVKYEFLLVHLIKELVYEPKTMANEILQLAKSELDPRLAIKLSSVLSSCANSCREVNNKHAPDDEMEEKWSEIIDWMGWLMSDKENDM